MFRLLSKPFSESMKMALMEIEIQEHFSSRLILFCLAGYNNIISAKWMYSDCHLIPFGLTWVNEISHKNDLSYLMLNNNGNRVLKNMCCIIWRHSKWNIKMFEWLIVSLSQSVIFGSVKNDVFKTFAPQRNGWCWLIRMFDKNVLKIRIADKNAFKFMTLANNLVLICRF